MKVLETDGRGSDIAVLVVPFDLTEVDGRIAAAKKLPAVVI